MSYKKIASAFTDDHARESHSDQKLRLAEHITLKLILKVRTVYRFCLEEGLVSRFHHEQKIMRTLYYFYQKFSAFGRKKFFLGKILNCPYRPTLEKKIVLIDRLLPDLSF